MKLLKNEEGQMGVPDTRVLDDHPPATNAYGAPTLLHTRCLVLTNREKNDSCRKNRSVGLAGLTHKHILKPVE